MLPHITAKDKVVRFRAVQITANLVNCTRYIDAQQSDLIRLALQKRILDKEVSIRTMAIVGLCSFANTANDDSDDQDSDDSDDYGAQSVMQKLIVRMQHDPSPEVRRNAVLNIPLEQEALPFVLERARDSDSATRRRVYTYVLPSFIDFRFLSMPIREKILRWGMQDRDEMVRKAAAKLFREHWLQDCINTPSANPKTSCEQTSENRDTDQQPPDTESDHPAAAKKQPKIPPPDIPALLELLYRVDVTHNDDSGWTHEVMAAFWDGRPDYRAHIRFDEDFWDDLTTESIFAARTLNDYCRLSKDAALLSELEDKMPVLTKFTFILDREVQSLIECQKEIRQKEIQFGGPDGHVDPEVAALAHSKTFIVEQMLAIALTLDFSDDYGRRNMLTLVRDSLAVLELPAPVTKMMVDILRLLSTSEADFTRLCLEAITDIRDSLLDPDAEKEQTSEDEDDDDDDDDDVEASFHSAVSAQSDPRQAKPVSKTMKDSDGDTSMEDDEQEQKNLEKIMVEVKCLEISQCLLENLQCEVDRNPSLIDLLNERIVPAVRSTEAVIRTRGIEALGLCVLLTEAS